MKVVRQSIVFYQSPIFRLEEFNDGEITVIDQLRSVEHFSAVLFVSLTLVFDDFFRDTQSNVSVVTSPTTLVTLRVLLDGMNFVIEKPRCFCFCVRNQGFCLGKFETQFLVQKGSETLLDLLRFLLWANKSQQKVIGIPTKSKSSVVGVVRNL